MERFTPAAKRYVGRYPGTFAPRLGIAAWDFPDAATDEHYILVVDDDPFFRSLFKVMLQQVGWPARQVWEAEDSRSALAILRVKPVDLVFCDFHLRKADSDNGLDLLRDLREFRRELPVFMITAENNETLIAQLCESGATGYLLKPINLRILRRVLHSNLAEIPFAYATGV